MPTAGKDCEGRNRQARHQDLGQHRGRGHANDTLELLPIRPILLPRNRLVIRLVPLQEGADIAERNLRGESDLRRIDEKRINAIVIDFIGKAKTMVEMTSDTHLTMEVEKRKVGIRRNERRVAVGNVSIAEVKTATTSQRISKPIKPALKLRMVQQRMKITKIRKRNHHNQ